MKMPGFSRAIADFSVEKRTAHFPDLFIIPRNGKKNAKFAGIGHQQSLIVPGFSKKELLSFQDHNRMPEQFIMYE